MPSKYDFFDFPAEMRNIIYEELVRGYLAIGYVAAKNPNTLYDHTTWIKQPRFFNNQFLICREPLLATNRQINYEFYSMYQYIAIREHHALPIDIMDFDLQPTMNWLDSLPPAVLARFKGEEPDCQIGFCVEIRHLIPLAKTSLRDWFSYSSWSGIGTIGWEVQFSEPSLMEWYSHEFQYDRPLPMANRTKRAVRTIIPHPAGDVKGADEDEWDNVRMYMRENYEEQKSKLDGKAVVKGRHPLAVQLEYSQYSYTHPFRPFEEDEDDADDDGEDGDADYAEEEDWDTESVNSETNMSSVEDFSDGEDDDVLPCDPNVNFWWSPIEAKEQNYTDAMDDPTWDPFIGKQARQKFAATLDDD